MYNREKVNYTPATKILSTFFCWFLSILESEEQTKSNLNFKMQYNWTFNFGHWALHATIMANL